MQTSTRLLSLFRARLGVRRAAALTMVAALAALPMSSACTRPQDDNASSYLVISSLNAASGNDPSHLGGVLQSDVISCADATGSPGDAFCPVNKAATMFPDLGQAKLALVMKNPTLAPTSANFITLTNYRVTFARTDGGTAVPPAFDSAVTVTVTGSDAQAGFVLVPTASKEIAPLLALRTSGEINTVATVTFFGKDQAGREIQATATIGVIFANWGG